MAWTRRAAQGRLRIVRCKLQPAANEKRLSQVRSAGRDLNKCRGDALSAFVSSFCKTFVVVCNPKHFLLRSFIS